MASRLPASCIHWPAGSRPWCPASQVRDNWPNPTLNMMMRCYTPQILQAASLSTRCAASPCWPPWATPSSWWWQPCSGETPLVNSDYMHTTRDDDVHSSSQLLYCSQCCAAPALLSSYLPFDPSLVYLRFWDVGRIWQGMRKTRFHGFHYRFLLYYCPQDLAYQFRWEVPRHH